MDRNPESRQARDPVTPFSVDRIDHVEVFVRDLDAAKTWYERVLGLREVRRWDPEPIMMGAGDTKIALFRGAPAEPRSGVPASQNPQRWHRVAWRTDAKRFEAAQRHLAELGVDFRGPIDHQTARSIYFEDLDGHPLEITCYEV
jgi:catechol 2,3-dioxygenase-like lactoylglutathione lyase family enzyme